MHLISMAANMEPCISVKTLYMQHVYSYSNNFTSHCCVSCTLVLFLNTLLYSPKYLLDSPNVALLLKLSVGPTGGQHASRLDRFLWIRKQRLTVKTVLHSWFTNQIPGCTKPLFFLYLAQRTTFLLR